jgi:hypothetical protein
MKHNSPWWGQSLSINIKKQRSSLSTLQITCMFMSKISMHEIFKVAYWLLCLFFPYFPFTQTIFFSRYIEEKKRPYCRRSKSIPTLSSLSLFSLHQIHLFLQKDWGEEEWSLLLQGVKKSIAHFVFSFLILPWPNPPFSQKRLRKMMDVAQTHFGAALYRLCVMLCTFGACNST